MVHCTEERGEKKKFLTREKPRKNNLYCCSIRKKFLSHDNVYVFHKVTFCPTNGQMKLCWYKYTETHTAAFIVMCIHSILLELLNLHRARVVVYSNTHTQTEEREREKVALNTLLTPAIQ